MQNACHNWLLNFETILFFPTVWTLWYEKFIFFKNNLSKEQLESVKIHRVLLLYILMCVCVCRVSLLLIGWTNTWRIKNNVLTIGCIIKKVQRRSGFGFFSKKKIVRFFYLEIICFVFFCFCFKSLLLYCYSFYCIIVLIFVVVFVFLHCVISK